MFYNNCKTYLIKKYFFLLIYGYLKPINHSGDFVAKNEHQFPLHIPSSNFNSIY